MSLHFESYKHVGIIWVIRPGTYVLKRRNTQDFVIYSVICSRMNLGYGKKRSNTRSFYIGLIILSCMNVAYINSRRKTKYFVID